LPFVDTLAGGGTDANRWSCNSDKWICLCVGWNGRNADGGSNQVLVNWVDREIVRTSMDTETVAANKICNETGDFWVGNLPATEIAKLPAPAALPAVKGTAVIVHDMLGRQLYSNATHRLGWDGQTLSGVTLKRGVYFVQVGSGKTIATHKLVIK
jgi:hypothetical protein